MRRFIYDDLVLWKDAHDRKPLIMYGARQVGKTYIIKEFGSNEFDDMVYINCYKNEAMSVLFSGDADVNRLILGISAYSRKKIVPGRTLVFLDEVQEIPPIVSSLKYFCEDMPELHVVVAGSLLGVVNLHGESFPVGKVNIMRLYPMSFEEFLIAQGDEQLAELIRKNEWDILNAFHTKLIGFLRAYYYVGGMPEAVVRYTTERDLIAVRRVQEEILAAYEADISKHTGNTSGRSLSETQRIRMVWQSIPSQLSRENKKFIYGAVRKGARAKDFEVAIQWLVDAGLAYRVERTRETRLPLKFYADRDAFKLYLLDVGLLGAMADTSPSQVLIGDSVFSEYKGAFTENFVLEQLKTLHPLPIYYYSKDNSRQELDFVLQVSDRVMPIEVKAEANVKSKSMHSFIMNDFKELKLKGVRFSMKGCQDQGWMVNVPLYATRGFVKKLLDDAHTNHDACQSNADSPE